MLRALLLGILMCSAVCLAEDGNARYPYVAVDRETGTYRLYQTDSVSPSPIVVVRKSKDLKEWSAASAVLTPRPEWGTWTAFAPKVYEHGGQYMLFVTMSAGVSSRQCIWAFSSASPDGPFASVAEASVTPPDLSCSGGMLWVENGEPYLVYCQDPGRIGAARIMAAKLNGEFSGFASEPFELHVPPAAVDGKGLDVSVEGPCLHRSIHSNRLFMIWSETSVGADSSIVVCESQTGRLVGPWARRRTLLGRGGRAMLFHSLGGVLCLAAHRAGKSPDEGPDFVRIDDNDWGLFEHPSPKDRPDKFDRIQVNQVGYLPNALKTCFCEAPPKLEFHVQRLDEETGRRCWRDVFVGKFRRMPRSTALFEGDFSCVAQPGDYRIVCGAKTQDNPYGIGINYDGVASEPFDIREGVYEPAERSFLNYYLWQRCGSRKGWAGQCHQDMCPLVDEDGKNVGELDARGGYHQSCDLRNWADGISLSAFNLLRYAEMGAPRWDDGELEEELRWGMDYFYRISSGADYVYDSQFVPIGWGPRRYYARPAPLGAQANVVMLFSRAARFFSRKDPAYAERLLARARKIFAQMEGNPFFGKAQPSGELPLPGGAQPWESWYRFNYRTTALGFSQRGGAALELYRTTNEGRYAELARQYGGEALRRAEAGEDMEVDCGYSRVLFGNRLFLELAREFGGDEWKRAAIAEAEEIVSGCEENCGPSTIYQGTVSIRFMTQAAYLLDAADVLGRPEWRRTAQRLVDFAFGSNPENSSMIEGVGYHQSRRPVFGQFYPSTPQIPGGVLHRVCGEYDMPAVSWTLLAVRFLEKTCGDCSRTR